MDILGFVDISLWIPLTILCLALLYIYGTSPMKTWSRLGVCGPTSLPFIGNMHQVMNKKNGAKGPYDLWRKQYGHVYGIQFFRKPCLVVTDIELLNIIFVKEFNSYHDRFPSSIYPKAFLDGLAFQHGHDWKRIRRILTPSFTSGKIKQLTKYMNTTARRLGSKVQEHAAESTKPKAKTVFGAFSNDVIAGALFGLDLDSQYNPDVSFFKKVESLFKIKTLLKLAIAINGMFPLTGKIFTTLGLSLFDPEGIQYFVDVFGKIVSERKENKENPKQSDLFQLILDAERDDTEEIVGDNKMTEHEIVCQGITFIIAGYETTSSTLQFVTRLLANNHDVQDKLIEEIRTVVTEPDLEVSMETCQNLKYTEAVIRETLRMYPPVVLLKREVTEDTTLNGIRLTKGVGIITPVYNIGRDPELFEDPDTFNPDRFINNDSMRPIQFLPFGFGPRSCIGMRLAMTEMKIALVHMLSKVYIMEAEPKEMELEGYTGFLTPKTPVSLTLKLH